MTERNNAGELSIRSLVTRIMFCSVALGGLTLGALGYATGPEREEAYNINAANRANELTTCLELVLEHADPGSPSAIVKLNNLTSEEFKTCGIDKSGIESTLAAEQSSRTQDTSLPYDSTIFMPSGEALVRLPSRPKLEKAIKNAEDDASDKNKLTPVVKAVTGTLFGAGLGYLGGIIISLGVGTAVQQGRAKRKQRSQLRT